MGFDTKIQWTHHTFNPWRGCTKVSAGCAHCYAETQSGRNPRVLGVWGPNGTRSIAAESYWREPFKWDRQAWEAGERRRVFCASLADVFEGRDTMPREAWEAVEAARARLFRTIDSTPHLDWLLLTKRPENFGEMWHSRSYYDEHGQGWGESVPTGVRHRRDNVWIGTSVEHQAAANERIPKLVACRDLVPVLFLSMEPLLGPVDFADVPLPRTDHGDTLFPGSDAWRAAKSIDWVIVGGESGGGARPCDVEWVRSAIGQCKAAGVAVFCKQLGAKPGVTDHSPDDSRGDNGKPKWVPLQLKDSKGGDISEFPSDLRVREMPEGVAS